MMHTLSSVRTAMLPTDSTCVASAHKVVEGCEAEAPAWGHIPSQKALPATMCNARCTPSKQVAAQARLPCLHVRMCLGRARLTGLFHSSNSKERSSDRAPSAVQPQASRVRTSTCRHA